MLENKLKDSIISPAFIYKYSSIRKNYEILFEKVPNIKLLFPVKSCSNIEVLKTISYFVDGFACSSEFETRLVNKLFNNSSTIHATTPSLHVGNFETLVKQSDIINANSLSQLSQLCQKRSDKYKIGIRINPELSFVKDNRYDPCKDNSKLGIRINQLINFLNENHNYVDLISGVLIHTNCESEDFNELLQTVKILDSNIPEILNKMEWINLGGGYLFDKTTNWKPFSSAVDLFRLKYGLEVYFEPGKGVVGRSGIIVSSIVDIFESGKKKIAILDTTVNHMPEVFEYQFQPEIKEECDSGRYKYILAGATCLVGDSFGEYEFESPLKVGSKITFLDMGAYSLVKAHWFNGVNLPNIYLLRENGKLDLVKEYTFKNYLDHCGVSENVVI